MLRQTLAGFTPLILPLPPLSPFISSPLSLSCLPSFLPSSASLFTFLPWFYAYFFLLAFLPTFVFTSLSPSLALQHSSFIISHSQSPLVSSWPPLYLFSILSSHSSDSLPVLISLSVFPLSNTKTMGIAVLYCSRKNYVFFRKLRLQNIIFEDSTNVYSQHHISSVSPV